MRRVKKWKGTLAFLLITLFVGLLLNLYPSLGDPFYGDFIYPLIRRFYDFLFQVFDQSLMLFCIGFLLYLLVNSILQNGLYAGIRYLLLLLALFYWIWGFNYFRTPLSQRLNLEFATVSDSLRLDITNATLTKCIYLSQKLDAIEDKTLAELLLKKGVDMADTLTFLSKTNLRVVPVQPATLFLRIGITGMYFPYTGQGQYESDLGPIDKPFTIAHEWCHSAGIGPEHEANFLAYLMCVSSDNKAIQYSAYMHLLNELLFHYKITDPKLFEEMRASFTPTMNRHMEERKEQFLKYSGPVSELSDDMIDQYLKFNQQEGIQDYYRLSEYIFAWEIR